MYDTILTKIVGIYWRINGLSDEITFGPLQFIACYALQGGHNQDSDRNL
jgi:hypothetical protein